MREVPFGSRQHFWIFRQLSAHPGSVQQGNELAKAESKQPGVTQWTSDQRLAQECLVEGLALEDMFSLEALRPTIQSALPPAPGDISGAISCAR